MIESKYYGKSDDSWKFPNSIESPGMNRFTYIFVCVRPIEDCILRENQFKEYLVISIHSLHLLAPHSPSLHEVVLHSIAWHELLHIELVSFMLIL